MAPRATSMGLASHALRQGLRILDARRKWQTGELSSRVGTRHERASRLLTAHEI